MCFVIVYQTITINYNINPSCCELAVVRSNEFVKVVLHLLKHSISQGIQLAAEGIVDGVDLTGGTGRAQLLSVVSCDVLIFVLICFGCLDLFGSIWGSFAM